LYLKICLEYRLLVQIIRNIVLLYNLAVGTLVIIFLLQVFLHIIVRKLGSSSHHVTVGLLNRFLHFREARNILSTFYRLDLSIIMSTFMDIFFTSYFSKLGLLSRPPPTGSSWGSNSMQEGLIIVATNMAFIASFYNIKLD